MHFVNVETQILQLLIIKKETNSPANGILMSFDTLACLFGLGIHVPPVLDGIRYVITVMKKSSDALFRFFFLIK